MDQKLEDVCWAGETGGLGEELLRESEQEDQLSRGQQISHSLSKTADPEAPGTPVNTSVVRSLHCEAEVRPHGEHCPD